MFRRIHSNLSSCWRSYHYKMSEQFLPQPNVTVKKEETISLGRKLLMDYGIINSRSSGMFALLPFGQRVFTKLTTIIEEEMRDIGAQKLSLPLLTSGHLWERTGRLESNDQELMTIQDRHDKTYILSPTHEEAITSLMAEIFPVSHKHLPILLYQITSKFRDELRPRFGLIRAREFVMKDLYTFDSSEAAANITYTKICSAYDRIFQRIGIPYLKVVADCGDIGGNFSHEYHYQTAIGEDILLLCNACGFTVNSELVADADNASCSICGNQLTKTQGIEVGHTFLLGTKYSKPIKAFYHNVEGKPELLQMGCYGLGVSRILATIVELLSKNDCIRWPWSLAPFKVCIITPKKGSKEESGMLWVDHLAQVISSMPGFEDDVLVDDRNKLSIGRRQVDADKMGYPLVIVVGKKACESIPLFEVIDRESSKTHFLTQKLVIDFLKQKSRKCKFEGVQ
ncbi:probable proline--tRNA ligase, mitochondrial isoform X1 [Procambarus clarkii]|uniref:probable proline--tRNA ligase, mitochondrial isoform X1 n=1 Tax=Procambarus clarkii TaxID=6728 RepID=UPI00374251C1